MEINKTLPCKTKKEREDFDTYLSLKLAQLVKNYNTTLNSHEVSRLTSQDAERNLIHTYYYKIFDKEQALILTAKYLIKNDKVEVQYSE